MLAMVLALIAPQGQDSLAASDIVYVDADATGANNGTSWQNAFTDLQPALAEAVTGNQIWVAEGIYRPSLRFDPANSRSATFQMKNGVALYGGFDPSLGDITLEDRDWLANPTILSGDIGVRGNASDNSYHVFYHPAGTDLDGSAILDGFTISDGEAHAAWPHYLGGGMYNDGSSPTLTNCIFADNSASDGGAIYNYSSSPTLTNCTFANNSGSVYSGGMYNYESSPVLTNCTFQGNSAGQGGGMYNWYAAPVLTNCTFVGNWSVHGGGMANESSSPVLINCTFADNSAEEEMDGLGGGMYNLSSSSPELINCTFSNNSASHAGGGVYNSSSSSPMLTNCTLAGNSPDGMRNKAGSSPTLTNCILWGNGTDQIVNEDYSSPAVTYSDIQAGCEAIAGNICGAGNINADPLFVSPAGGNLRLWHASPCIDAGDNAAPDLPGYDFEGHPRIMDGDGDGTATVDMGVDEALGHRVYVPLALGGR